MGIGALVQSLLTACPPLGRALVRGYCRSAGYVPAAARWRWYALQYALTPPGSLRTVRLARGLRLRLDAGTVQGNAIYYGGSGDPSLARFLQSFLRPGMTFIDAGANLGEFALRAARLVGPRGRVYALEAAAATFRELEYNVALNRLGNVRPLCAAVGDVDGPVSFYAGHSADGSASLFPAPGTGPATTVPGVILDTLAQREGLAAVDLIKLDVEGAEFAACRGMRRLLNGPSPPVIVFEYHAAIAARQGWNLDDLCAFLREQSYRVRHLRHGQPGPDAGQSRPGAGNPSFVASRAGD